MTTKRILIIDDEPRLQTILKMTLEMMAEWTILTASSGTEGLAIARAEQPDAILMDLMMPDMDGMETLQRLRANQETQNIPVILLTAQALPRQLDRLTQLGVVTIIEKPFDPLELSDLISEALGWNA